MLAHVSTLGRTGTQPTKNHGRAGAVHRACLSPGRAPRGQPQPSSGAACPPLLGSPAQCVTAMLRAFLSVPRQALTYGLQHALPGAVHTVRPWSAAAEWPACQIPHSLSKPRPHTERPVNSHMRGHLPDVWASEAPKPGLKPSTGVSRGAGSGTRSPLCPGDARTQVSFKSVPPSGLVPSSTWCPRCPGGVQPQPLERGARRCVTSRCGLLLSLCRQTAPRPAVRFAREGHAAIRPHVLKAT